MTDPPLSPAVAWLEEVYAAAVADHDHGVDRDHAQAYRLAQAAQADTTGRTYQNGDDQ